MVVNMALGVHSGGLEQLPAIRDAVQDVAVWTVHEVGEQSVHDGALITSVRLSIV